MSSDRGGERYIERLLPGDKQRREAQLIEMRQKVPGAEQHIDPGIAPEGEPVCHPAMLL